MGLRKSLENIVYAGMHRTTPTDPLYLSNQRWSSRLKPLLVLGVPCLALIIGVEVAATRTESEKKIPYTPPTAVLALLRMSSVSFPAFQSSKLEVLEVAVRSAHGIQVEGAVRNRSEQTIGLGRVSLELQDADGQFTGSIEADLSHIRPGAVARFQMPVPQDARRVLVTGITVE